MPQYVELSPTIPGLAEEDCLYPVSPQLLPSISPYVQPHPLTSAQLHGILRAPNLGFPLLNYNNHTLPNSTSSDTVTRSSTSFVHPSVLPYSKPAAAANSSCGPQAPYCLQNLQMLQLQLQQAQLQHLRHATLPR